MVQIRCMDGGEAYQDAEMLERRADCMVVRG